MKNRLFSFGIFKETIRQLKLIGIIMTAFGIVTSVGTAVLSFMSQPIERVSSSASNFSTVPAIAIIYVGFFAVYLTAFISTLKVFGYVNTRNSADFYHSLPETRECVFVSSATGILAVSLSSLLISVGVGVLAYTVSPMFAFKTLFVPYADVLYGTLCLCAMVFLMVTSASIAVSLTGTKYMNAIVTVLLVVVPRVLINTVTSTLTANAPVLVRDSFGAFFSPDSNLLLSSFSPLILGTSINIFSVIYTFVLALVYGAVACFLFKKRKSESAHSASATPLLQAVFRIAVAVFLCVLSFPFIAEFGYDSAWIVWYAIVVVLYFAFELFTTKKWKNALRAVPGLFIAAAILVATFFGTKLASDIALSYEPSADEIESVRIISSTDYYINDELYPISKEGGTFANYALSKASNVSVYDREVAKLVSEGLKESNEKCRKKAFDDYGGDYFIRMEITTTKGSKKRIVRMAPEDYTKIISSLSKNEHYRNNYLKLPAAKAIRYEGDTVISADGLDELYELLREEIAQLDFAEWHNYLTDGQWIDPDAILRIVTDESSPAEITIPFGKAQAPKTYEKLVCEYLIDIDNAKEKLSIIKDLKEYCEKNGIDVKSEYLYVYADGFIFEDGGFVTHYLSLDFDKYYDYEPEETFETGEVCSDENGTVTAVVDAEETEQSYYYIDTDEFVSLAEKALEGEVTSDMFMRVYVSVDITDENGKDIFEPFACYMPMSEELKDLFIS